MITNNECADGVLSETLHGLTARTCPTRGIATDVMVASLLDGSTVAAKRCAVLRWVASMRGLICRSSHRPCAQPAALVHGQ